MPSAACLKQKLVRWKLFWNDSRREDKPEDFMDALPYADEDIFPNIRQLILIGCTTPIGTCQAERSFSVLRRIKLTFNNDRRKVDRSNHDVYPPCRMFVVLITVSVCRYKRKLLYHDLCKKNLGVCFANLFCLMSQKIRLFILCSFHLYKAVYRFKIVSGQISTMC